MQKLIRDKELIKQLKNYPIPDFDKKLAIIRKWHNAYRESRLQEMTETQCEQAFNNAFFTDILGYASFPEDPYTICPKVRVASSGGQKPDFALGYFSGKKPDPKQVQVVGEVKNAKADLDKAQRAKGNLSPTEQAHNYKGHYNNCIFFIASNFYEIRLFKDNLQSCEVWTLDDLVNSEDNHYQLKKFYRLLSADNLIAREGDSETSRLIQNTNIQYEEITKDFYVKYKGLRQKLIENIKKNNESKPIDLVIEKSQKIIDRIVFIHFCEDLGLLPSGNFKEVKEVTDYSGKTLATVWDKMKDFFNAIDKGSERHNIPEGYNGELFKEDPELDSLVVNNSICRGFADLGKYDFEEDLTVNVLGHIFEQSISDIEELKGLVNRKQGKRKQDGIYYTPDYIVDYIVNNSLGVYLRGKKVEIEDKYRDNRNKIKDKDYIKVLRDYQNILSDVKILDPACGSGAFLVKVFDFLYSENKRIVEETVSISNTDPNTDAFFDQDEYIRSILQNNIYGVDLNAESVEITKLSLWLKTARKGKKLTDLRNNIRCGNSLVEDVSVSGDKAFVWSDEFKSIMDNGGFDVIVGNPPYGANLSEEERKWLRKKYNIGSTDTAQLFIKESLNLLQADGIGGFIIPKPFIYASNWRNLRKELLPYLNILVDCKKVWQEVKLEQVICTLQRIRSSITYKAYKRNNNDICLVETIDKSHCKRFDFILNDLTKEEIQIGLKLLKQNHFLNDIGVNQRGDGVQKYLTERGDIQFIGGGNIQRCYIKGVKGFLKKNIDFNGKAIIKDNSILVQQIIAHIENPFNHIKITSTIPQNGELYILDTINQIVFREDISNKVIMLILHSVLLNWFVYRFIYAKAIRTMHFDNPVTSRIPIAKAIISNQEPFIKRAKKMLSLNKDLQAKIDNFLKVIKTNYPPKKSSKKLDKFYELEFKAFFSLLKKLSIEAERLSHAKQQDLMEYFEGAKKEIIEIKNKIDETDRQIDGMVFDLYGLTDKERKIVLGS